MENSEQRIQRQIDAEMKFQQDASLNKPLTGEIMPNDTARMETNLSNKELVARVDKWNSLLCKTGGTAWTLRIPPDVDNDPDLLIAKLCGRFEKQSEEIEALRSLVRQACIDLNSAHDEIMKLQDCPNPQDFDYPEWSSPANTIRSAEKMLGEHLAKTNNWTLFIKEDTK